MRYDTGLNARILCLTYITPKKNLGMYSTVWVLFPMSEWDGGSG